MKSSKLKISVIIPTFNSWGTLKSCLESIFKQSLKPTEVLVIDNASSDNTSLKVKKYFSRVKLITLDRNTGVTGGRNTGIDHLDKKSDYVLFFDHDMLADKEMLKNLVTASQLDNNFGIITPKIYYWEIKDKIWAAGTNINLLTGQVLFRGGHDNGQFENIEQVQVAPAALFVKREVLDVIYGFDNRYFATYEDTDFCYRASKSGFKTIYTPYALAYHKISPFVTDDQNRLLSRSYWIGRNRILFMGEYGKNFYLFLLFSPLYILYFIKLSLAQRDIKGLTNYLRGFVSGLVEELLTRRLMVYLPFTMYNNLLNVIGDSSKTVLDVACGDGFPMEILNYKKKWQVTGIDIFNAYVYRARQRDVYKEVILGDVKYVDKIFKGYKFNVILCSSLMEHLPKKEALELLTKLEKLGNKVVISGLPNGYLEKEEPHFWEGDNPYQIHRSSWSINDFKDREYVVRGVGVSFLLGKNRLSSKLKFALFRTLMLVVENLLAYFLAWIPFYFPKYSVGLMAYKNKI